MTRKKNIFLLTLIAFSVSIFLAPRMVDLEALRIETTESLVTKTGWQIRTSSLDWKWLPFPHLSLRHTSVIANGAEFVVPEILIYPQWLSALQGELKLSGLELINPRFWVDSLPQIIGENAIMFPGIDISIINGYADFKPGLFGKEYPYIPLELSSIDAKFIITPERLSLEGTSESSLFNSVDLNASFEPSDNKYSLSYHFNGLQLYNLLPTFLDGKLLPLNSTISITGKTTGQGSGDFKADVQGDFPCFVSPATPESFLLECGSAQLNIERKNGYLTVDIEKLALKNPGSLLTGRIAKFQGTEEVGLDKKPVWLIDLKGENLDLSDIRKGVLTLWGDHKIARIVCDIVLGGTARSASYYFRDTAEGFKDIRKMNIIVDVQESQIHPPKTPLILENASGPIEIIDGQLSGMGLTAGFKNSIGTSCSLYLDLTGRTDEFKLDLDIDADLKDLPPVLYDLIKDDLFRKELMQFSKVSGEATAHLIIGDTLSKPLVTVRVESIDGGAEYERLGQYLRVREGVLSLLPGKIVSWENIVGSMGTHLVQGSTGEVTWSNGIKLNIKKLKGSFDSRKLLEDLSASPDLAKNLKNIVTTAEGQVLLKDGQFSGPPRTPTDWTYRFELLTSGSRFTSPLLPGPTRIGTARVVVTEDNIRLFDSNVRHYDNPLQIEGEFKHKSFSDWQGWAMFSGTVNNETGKWLSEKGWIPENYFPSIPCVLDKFNVTWRPGSTKLSGKIGSAPKASMKASMRFDMLFDHEKIEIKDLVVVSPDEQGHLSALYKKDGSNDLKVRWQGFIDSVTVGNLLAENIIKSERFQGDFSFQYPFEPKASVFDGWVKVAQLEWPLAKEKSGLVINELNLSSEENGSVQVEAIIDAMGDEVELDGKVDFYKEKISFDLDLEASELTGRAVNQVLHDIKNKLSDKENAGKGSVASGKGHRIKGQLGFDIDTLSYGKKTETTEQLAPNVSNKFVLSPAEGYLTIDSSEYLYSLTLVDSKICGLDISGTFNSESSKNDSYLRVFTNDSSAPQLEHILPCFGFNNSIIDGKIDFSLDFKGSANKWHTGKADLVSDGGYIHQLGFLSKLFRIVNLSDIFSVQKLPDFANEGFGYSKMTIASHIRDNVLVIDKAIIKGEGLNLFGQGEIDLTNWTANLTVMVAPLKTVDAILTNIPLLGKVVGGADKAVISIPVSVKGSLRDPDVNLLPAGAIGEGLLNLITNTLMMPFQIFSPLVDGEDNSQKP